MTQISEKREDIVIVQWI